MKKTYFASLASFLLIPVVMLAAGLLFSAIDPERAAGHANYERNYRLLEWLRQAILAGGFFVSLGLWLATCYLLLKSRRRSPTWMAAAVFGPLGFAALAMLNDAEPAPADIHEAFRARLGLLLRAVYEGSLFIAIWVAAFGFVALKDEATAIFEAHRRGVPVDLILQERAASSGMMAFGDGLQVMYLVVLLYLLWPLVVNGAGGLWRWLRRKQRV